MYEGISMTKLNNLTVKRQRHIYHIYCAKAGKKRDMVKGRTTERATTNRHYANRHHAKRLNAKSHHA